LLQKLFDTILVLGNSQFIRCLNVLFLEPPADASQVRIIECFSPLQEIQFYHFVEDFCFVFGVLKFTHKHGKYGIVHPVSRYLNRAL